MGQADKGPFGAHEHIGISLLFSFSCRMLGFPLPSISGEERSSVIAEHYQCNQGDPGRQARLLC